MISISSESPTIPQVRASFHWKDTQCIQLKSISNRLAKILEETKNLDEMSLRLNHTNLLAEVHEYSRRIGLLQVQPDHSSPASYTDSVRSFQDRIFFFREQEYRRMLEDIQLIIAKLEKVGLECKSTVKKPRSSNSLQSTEELINGKFATEITNEKVSNGSRLNHGDSLGPVPSVAKVTQTNSTQIYEDIKSDADATLAEVPACGEAPKDDAAEEYNFWRCFAVMAIVIGSIVYVLC